MANVTAKGAAPYVGEAEKVGFVCAPPTEMLALVLAEPELLDTVNTGLYVPARAYECVKVPDVRMLTDAGAMA